MLGSWYWTKPPAIGGLARFDYHAKVYRDVSSAHAMKWEEIFSRCGGAAQGRVTSSFASTDGSTPEFHAVQPLISSRFSTWSPWQSIQNRL
jgi:hypothetical protein